MNQLILPYEPPVIYSTTLLATDICNGHILARDTTCWRCGKRTTCNDAFDPDNLNNVCVKDGQGGIHE